MEGVPVPVVVSVEVDDLDAEHLARLGVLSVLSDDGVDVLDDAVRLLGVRHVLGVHLELLEDLVALALLQDLVEERILLEDVQGGSGVRVDLANDVRELNTILLLGLVDHLVKDAISTDLQGTGLHLSALLGVRVVCECAHLALLRLLGELLRGLLLLLESLG